MTLEHLSGVQIEILRAIHHVGWYGQLWFPTVYRDALDFPEGPSDEQVHAAIFALIQSGLLEIWRIGDGDAIQAIDPNDNAVIEIQKHTSDTNSTGLGRRLE